VPRSAAGDSVADAVLIKIRRLHGSRTTILTKVLGADKLDDMFYCN